LNNLKKIVFLTISLTSFPAIGQESSDAWDWKVAPYLWTMAGDGSASIGPLVSDIDFDFGDVVSNLDFAAELFIAADRGHHGFHGDFQYMDLHPDPVPAPIGSGQIDTKLELTTAEAAYRYHASGSNLGSTFLLGARYIDTTITLTPTLLAPAKASVDWVDGFVGYQYVGQLSAKWDSQFQVTAGTGGSELTLTGQLVFARKFSSGNALAIGARVWDIDYEETLGIGAPFELDLTLYGLLLGYIFD
jgi:hypothetical protein